MNDKGDVLVSGASFAGLATAYWMTRSGYRVTLVEIGNGLKRGGTPVNIGGDTIDIAKRMGLFEGIRTHRITMEGVEFKDASDGTEGRIPAGQDAASPDGSVAEEYEIERDVLLGMMFELVKDDVEVRFGDSIVSLEDDGRAVKATFRSGGVRSFDLVFGCDGIHSAVRNLWFGDERDFVHFLHAYFSITIVDRLLIRENTAQMYNEPGLSVILNAYNNKTDIVLCFSAKDELPYDYRDEDQQRTIITERFSGRGWRVPELLQEVRKSDTFYFDKLCQVKMPSWTKGRVALVGDAGYCASPAAGRGGSLAVDGAGALAQAFAQSGGDYEAAFRDYNQRLRPFIERVQAEAAEFGISILVPETEEAIRERNAHAASRE